MSITSYTELQAAVKRWLHRGDLDAHIPDFISLGEARINRMLRLPLQQAVATINPSATDRYVALPTRYMELVTFADDQGDPVQYVTAAQLEAAAAGATAGRPSYYRITSRIDFERVADATYNFTMVYKARLDLAADENNDMLSLHPDIYLYSALLAAAPYLNNDARIVTWGELLRAAIQEANETTRGQLKVRTELDAGEVFDIQTG